MLPQLASLDLGGQRFGDAVVPLLRPTLAMMTRLTELNLANNYLGGSAEGTASLASALAPLTQLTSLDLRHNGLRAAASLMPAIATMQ